MATAHTNLIKLSLIALSKVQHTRAWQVDTGVARSMDGERIIKFGLKGHSDIFIISKGRAMFAEIKIGNDKQNEDQINFERMVTNCGGKYFLIRDQKDIDEMIKSL